MFISFTFFPKFKYLKGHTETATKLEFISYLTHSPSMRSISADVGAHVTNQHGSGGVKNYQLLNKSQDLASIHSSHSTHINVLPTTAVTSSLINPANASPSFFNNNNHHSHNTHGSRKISRILYEIGSILSFVGLGRDFKLNQAMQQQAQTHSAPSNSSVLLSATPSSGSGHKTRRSQDKKQTPSTNNKILWLNTKSIDMGENSSNSVVVEKTSKYRFKSLSTHKKSEDLIDYSCTDSRCSSSRLSPAATARTAASVLAAQSAAAQAASTNNLHVGANNLLCAPKPGNMLLLHHEQLKPHATVQYQQQQLGCNNSHLLKSMQKKYSKSIDCTHYITNIEGKNNSNNYFYYQRENSPSSIGTMVDGSDGNGRDQTHQQQYMMHTPTTPTTTITSQTNQTIGSLLNSSKSGISFSGSYQQNHVPLYQTTTIQSVGNHKSSSTSISSISNSNSINGSGVGVSNHNASTTSVNAALTSISSSPLVPRRHDYEPVMRITTIQRQHRIYEQPSPTQTIGSLVDEYLNTTSTLVGSMGHGNNGGQSIDSQISIQQQPNRPLTLDLKQAFNETSLLGNNGSEMTGSGGVGVSVRNNTPSPMLINRTRNQIGTPNNATGNMAGHHAMHTGDTSPFSTSISSSASAGTSSVPSSLSPLATSPRLIHRQMQSNNSAGSIFTTTYNKNNNNNNNNDNKCNNYATNGVAQSPSGQQTHFK